MVIYVILSFLVGLIAGEYFIARSYSKYMALKSETPNRTAINVRGKFYYVIPEKEYVELDLLRQSRNQGKRTKEG